jgi:regulator of replication initiation timing
MENEKETLIEAYKEKLNELYQDVSADKQFIAHLLIEEVAFMKVTLDGLKKEILEKGVSDEYTNGEHQKGIKATAEFKAYNTMVSRYQMTVVKLGGMLPKKAAANKLMEFLNS